MNVEDKNKRNMKVRHHTNPILNMIIHIKLLLMIMMNKKVIMLVRMSKEHLSSINPLMIAKKHMLMSEGACMIVITIAHKIIIKVLIRNHL